VKKCLALCLALFVRIYAVKKNLAVKKKNLAVKMTEIEKKIQIMVAALALYFGNSNTNQALHLSCHYVFGGFQPPSPRSARA